MAVYTEVSDEDLSTFVTQYDIGAVLSCKGIAEGVENSNYLLRTEGGAFILTLYEKRVDAQDLPFFLGLMQHLSARGLTCPQPVSSRNGQALGHLAGRPAAIVTFLDGLSVRKPDASHCHMVGATLGALHHAGTDYGLKRANALSLDGWLPLVNAVKDRADNVQSGLATVLTDELTALQFLWPKCLPGGIIHADLFPDNVLFLADRLSGLIDFYFACNDAFAYDIAICLNVWCFEPDSSFNLTKSMAFLDGYKTVRQLTDAERMALPVLARGAALRFLLTRIADWLDRPPGALVSERSAERSPCCGSRRRR